MKFIQIAPWIIMGVAVIVAGVCSAIAARKRDEEETDAHLAKMIKTQEMKKKYHDAPDPEDIEAFTYWLCGRIDRDFDYETNDFDDLGPNGEDGKKKMLEMVSKGYIANIEDYDENCRSMKEADRLTVDAALRKKAIQRYHQEKLDEKRPAL